MLSSKAHNWLRQGSNRQRILLAFSQPMTAKQLARRTNLTLDRCSRTLRDLRLHGLVECLSPRSRRSRVYWLTPRGRACQRKLRQLEGLPGLSGDWPQVDWELYSQVCYSHRAAVLLALTAPMQPSQIKRRAQSQNSRLRMSANNVRDVIRELWKKGLARPAMVRRRAHPRYELTEVGREMQVLLVRAEMVV